MCKEKKTLVDDVESIKKLLNLVLVESHKLHQLYKQIKENLKH